MELKFQNEELNDNYVELVNENSKVVGQMDAMTEELVKEKAKSAILEAELEATLKKMQFIAVNAILHVRAKLMGEFKRVEHASWDSDQEIQTWKDREDVFAKGDEEESEEEESELTPTAESAKQAEKETIERFEP